MVVSVNLKITEKVSILNLVSTDSFQAKPILSAPFGIWDQVCLGFLMFFSAHLLYSGDSVMEWLGAHMNFRIIKHGFEYTT